ncbi:MAG: MarR family winged helix-turn-helix transcriptional regulator [Gammaproteobacteria bacterium]|nr:MarR family winged helix-turn-helix transcriptional regulator [Gammaproteobacteria bacterium]
MDKYIRTPAGVMVENLLREAELLSRELQTACPIDAPGLGPAHSRCLESLSIRGPGRLPEIAERLDCSRQRAQQLVETLIAQKAVRRVTNPNHRRSAHIEITDRGRKLLHRLIAQQTQLSEELAVPLSPQEIKTTLQTLRQLHRLMADRRPGQGTPT